MKEAREGLANNLHLPRQEEFKKCNYDVSNLKVSLPIIFVDVVGAKKMKTCEATCKLCNKDLFDEQKSGPAERFPL